MGYENEQLERMRDVVLQRLHLAVSQKMRSEDLRMADFQSYIDALTGDMVLQLGRAVWSERKDSKTYEYPATWWDGFKIAWFPKWLRRRFPAQIKRVVCELDIQYPGLKIKVPNEQHFVCFRVQEEEAMADPSTRTLRGYRGAV